MSLQMSINSNNKKKLSKRRKISKCVYTVLKPEHNFSPTLDSWTDSIRILYWFYINIVATYFCVLSMDTSTCSYVGTEKDDCYTHWAITHHHVVPDKNGMRGDLGASSSDDEGCAPTTDWTEALKTTLTTYQLHVCEYLPLANRCF